MEGDIPTFDKLKFILKKLNLFQILPEPGAGGRGREAIFQAAGNHALEKRRARPKASSDKQVNNNL